MKRPFMDQSRRQTATRSLRGRASLLISALLVGACQHPIDVAVTAASADATTTGGAPTSAAAPTTTGVATDATTSTTDATTSTTAGGGTGADATSGVWGECPSIEDPTTGAINPQVVEECDALCARYQECGLKEHELCQMGCVAKFGVDHQECYEAGSAARTCLTAMTCEELGAYLQFNDGGPCRALLDGQQEACTCQSQSGSGTDLCVYNLDCPYVPFRSISCFHGTCKCYVGEDVVKTCPQGDTCEDWLDLLDKAESCCCMMVR